MIAQVIKVNEILEQALLFDFYGELLTEHQKEIYGQFIQEDLSLCGLVQPDEDVHQRALSRAVLP